MAAAVEGAGRVLEAGWGEGLKPEERLRRAITACALERSDVLDVVREWKPKPGMKLWPSKPKYPLGGFDLAFRMKGDGGVTVAAETKWCGGTGFDALDQTPWDVIKLVHARTMPGVRWALLITAARTPAWVAARFARMFDESVTPIMELLTLNPHMFEEDAKSRPLALPPYVQSSPVARSAFMFGGKEWQIRVASVCANGEPWLDCDEDGWPRIGAEKAVMDWPHPEAGLGMVHDEGGPTPPHRERSTVPGPTATWADIEQYAYEVDGYRTHGERLGDMANSSAEHFGLNHAIDGALDLDDLRACLFFEARRHHHFGHAPGYDSTLYIRALMAAISERQPD